MRGIHRVNGKHRNRYHAWLRGISNWSYREWRCEKTQHRHNYYRCCTCRILRRRLGDLIKYNLDKANNGSPFLFLALKNNQKTNRTFTLQIPKSA